MTDFQAPREDLVRLAAQPGTLEFRAGDGDGNGVLFGYAAVFDTWTEINSWEGRFKERLARGAFRKTLKERATQIKCLFNHGFDPQIGDKPLGAPTVMKEDARGLYVEVPLDDTSYNKDIRALLKSKALNGMSFRMSVVGEKWDKQDEDVPERTISEVRLYEFGPVTFPAYEATVAGVRAHAPAAFEAWRSAQAGGGRKVTTHVGPDVPVNPARGDLWLDAEDNSLSEWTGKKWKTVDRQMIAAVDSSGEVTATIDADGNATVRTLTAVPDPPADDDTPTSGGDGPGTTPTPAAGEQDPAPTDTGHADDSNDDEPPAGHSSTPAWASNPAARKAHLAYVRQMHSDAMTRRSVHEKSVLAYEAEQTPEGVNP